MVAPLPENLDELVRIMESRAEAEDRRIQAITALGNLLGSQQGDLSAPRGIMALIEQVKQDDNPLVVGHCVGVLGRIRALSAVMVIVDVALGTHIALYEGPGAEVFRESDESLRLRCAAVQALGRMQDERSVIPLMSLLNDRTVNYRLRLAAAESLGRAGDPHALGSLVDILEDEREKSVYLKESAAKALGMLGDIRAMDSLIRTLESKRGIRDKFDFLKEQIIEAIGRIGGREDGAYKASDVLMRSLGDEAASIRLAAVEALGDIGDSTCIPRLQDMLRDEDDDVAVAAVAAIYNLGGEAAVRELLVQENLPQFLRDELESYIP